jgi:Zn-dependent protease/CBS domain-containing protein
MQWSFPLFRVAGSELRIHITFFLILLWFGIIHFQQGGIAAAISGIAFILAIFACVLLHEFGHALAARRFGIATPRITLLPIGGLAEMERMPEKPSEEIIVAVAGPLVNVVIALILLIYLGFALDPEAISSLEDPTTGFIQRLAAVNIILVLFNMIPAFPMDGGRVLRALLAMRYTRVQATETAARIGQMTAFLFGFLGLLSGNVILIFVAIFVYIAAAAEAQQTLMIDITRTMAAREAMITKFESLAPGATLEDAAKALLRTTQHEFPVVDHEGKLLGILTRADLVSSTSEHGNDYPVVEAMQTEIPAFRTYDRLDKALAEMQKSKAPAIAVTDASQRLLGYITLENIGEVMMLRSARTS